MGVYNTNKNGVVTRVATNNILRNMNTEQYVTEGELVEAMAKKQDIMQFETLPTASVDNLGKIYQYVGETTTVAPIYTQGYFYKCVSDGGDPATYSWEDSTNKFLIPEEHGAVGDGVTYDTNAFPNGDNIFVLGKGKSYRVTNAKMQKILGNGVVGKGKIIATSDETSSAYRGYYEKSTRSPKNRFEECNEYANLASTWNTRKLNRDFKRPGYKKAANATGHLHGIAAVYIDEDKKEFLPQTFTLCIGRNAVWTQTHSDKEWVKVIDDNGIRDIKNYALPWVDGAARDFDHAPTIVDGHTEIVINADELTTWKGSGDKEEGCVHFWGNNYYFNLFSDMDNIISCFEVWIKEPEAANLLYVASDIDLIVDGAITQATAMVDLPITTERQIFWTATMPVDECREVDVAKLETDLFGDYDTLNNKPTHFESTTRRVSQNVLGLDEFDLTAGSYQLEHDSNDIFTITKASGSNTWGTFALGTYLKKVMPIKAGDKYRVNIEFLSDYPSSWIFTLYVAQPNADNNINIQPSANTTGKQKDGKTYSWEVTAANDCTAYLNIGTSSNYITSPVSFRMWITKGEDYIPYSKYGSYISGRVLNYDVVDEILEQRVDELEETVVTKVSSILTPSADIEGLIIQYVGTTNANYINGYFYKCVEILPSTTPKTYSWEQISVQPLGVSLDVLKSVVAASSDFADFQTRIAAL